MFDSPSNHSAPNSAQTEARINESIDNAPDLDSVRLTNVVVKQDELEAEGKSELHGARSYSISMRRKVIGKGILFPGARNH